MNSVHAQIRSMGRLHGVSCVIVSHLNDIIIKGGNMTKVKAKTKVGGIEELYGPEVFFGLLGWTDRKFPHNRKIKFNVSSQQAHVLETISVGIHAGSMSSVARAAFGLGTLVEALQKGRHMDVTKGVLRDMKIDDTAGENSQRIVDKLILQFNFASDKMLGELKEIIERNGNNKLGEYVWNRVKPSYPFGSEVVYLPKIKSINGFISSINWGCVDLDDEKRFKLWRSPENIQIEFKCTKRLVVMANSMNREFFHFTRAKFARGVFVKGLHILATWFKANDSTVAEWYNIARLIEKLDMLHVKAY